MSDRDIEGDGREERVTRNREVMAFRHGVLGEKEEGMELTAVFKS